VPQLGEVAALVSKGGNDDPAGVSPDTARDAGDGNKAVVHGHPRKILVVAALLHLAVAGSITTGLTWASFSFAVSAITLRILNHLAWRWAHEAALASEAFAAHLFRTRNLHIRDSTGKFHNVKADVQS
jgi:hypothetical protein